MNQDLKCSVSFTQYAIFSSKRPQSPDIDIFFSESYVLSKFRGHTFTFHNMHIHLGKNSA